MRRRHMGAWHIHSRAELPVQSHGTKVPYLNAEAVNMVGVVKGHVVLVSDHFAIFVVVLNITAVALAAAAAAPVVQRNLTDPGRSVATIRSLATTGQRRSCMSGVGRLDSSRHPQIHSTKH